MSFRVGRTPHTFLMAKSTGNFITLNDAIARFSADGTRLALADAGDTLEDSNFVYDMADGGLLRLYSQLDWIKEIIGQRNSLRDDPRERFTYHDRIFDNEMNRLIQLADENYENMMFRDAIKASFYDLQAARDRYRDITGAGDGMNWQLMERFIKVQALLLSPICPHFCEYVWTVLLKMPDFIVRAHWPEGGAVDSTLIKEANYLSEVVHEFRVRIKKMMDIRVKKEKAIVVRPDYGVIYVAEHYPEWQHVTLLKLLELYNEELNSLPPNKDILAELKKMDALKPHMKKLMQFVQYVKGLLQVKGKDALDPTAPFNEKFTLQINSNYLVRSLELKELWIESVSASTDQKIREECAPGKPMTIFTSTPHKTSLPVTMVNPQRCVGYFTISIAIYDGDTFLCLVDRVRRESGVPGNLGMNLRMYKKDPRSIPVFEDSNGLVDIGPNSCFSILDQKVLLSDPEHGCNGVDIGNCMQYVVAVS